jgi:hypothetical protein
MRHGHNENANLCVESWEIGKAIPDRFSLNVLSIGIIDETIARGAFPINGWN